MTATTIVVEKTKSKKIKIVEVEGEIYGGLAVTRCRGTIGNRKHTDWTVTHRRTGYSVYHCIASKTDAIKLAQMLRNLDWNFRSPKSPKVKAMAPAVEKIIKKWFKERK